MVPLPKEDMTVPFPPHFPPEEAAEFIASSFPLTSPFLFPGFLS